MIAIPPLSFFLTVMFGGFLFSRIPNPSNSFSIIFLSWRGFRTSSTIKMRLQVRATEETLSVSLANGRVVTRTSDDYRRPA